MRLAAVLALGMLVGCGGGSGSRDPVTHVTLVQGGIGGSDARAFWDEDGNTSIAIYEWTTTDRVGLLEHELWHLLTRDLGHPNPYGCISYVRVADYAENGEPVPGFPCSTELTQVFEAGRVLTVSFPEDPVCLLEAAAFWNDALGTTAVEVVP